MKILGVFNGSILSKIVGLGYKLFNCLSAWSYFSCTSGVLSDKYQLLGLVEFISISKNSKYLKRFVYAFQLKSNLNISN